MHEHSLVHALLEQVERLAGEQGAGEVEEVRVQLGPLSGVEPLLVQSAFEMLAPATIAGQARLVIDEGPLLGQCAHCRHRFEIIDFKFLCPICDSRNIEIKAGDGFVLESITVHRDLLTGVDACQGK